MGHGIDFGEELAANHRQIRDAAAAAPMDVARLCTVLRQHTRLLRRHVLPAVANSVPSGVQIAAADEVVLGWIERELGDKELPERRSCHVDQLGSLLDLIEVQLDWEERILLPFLEAETTWIVLEDLADHARLARHG
jgi:hypothetical protein